MPDVPLTCDRCRHAPAVTLLAYWPHWREAGRVTRVLCEACAAADAADCRKAGWQYHLVSLAWPDQSPVTEWALAYTHRPNVSGVPARRVVQPYPDEQSAREAVAAVRSEAPGDEPGLMHRKIGPWKEAPDNG